MTPEQAFALLGLSEDCDQAAATKAYHELSLRHHPDIRRGDAQFQSQLNAAHKIVAARIAARKSTTAAAPRPGPPRAPFDVRSAARGARRAATGAPGSLDDAAYCAAELARAINFRDRDRIVAADISLPYVGGRYRACSPCCGRAISNAATCWC